MADGWKYVASSFSLETSGNLSAAQVTFSDKNYQGQCGEVQSYARVQPGSGHLSMSCTAVAEVGAGDVGHLAPSFAGLVGAVKGQLSISVSDANGAMIVKKNYATKDWESASGDLVTDALSGNPALIPAGTYDPNNAQYASLFIEVNLSGKVSQTIDVGHGSAPFC